METCPFRRGHWPRVQQRPFQHFGITQRHYRFNDQFAAGVALNFNYAKYRDARRTAYGGSLVSLYNPVPFLQISAELEQLRVNNNSDNVFVRIEENYWAPALFLGIGYTQQYVTIGVRYDVLYDDDKSIYAGALMPFVRGLFLGRLL